MFTWENLGRVNFGNMSVVTLYYGGNRLLSTTGSKAKDEERNSNTRFSRVYYISSSVAVGG